MPIDFPNSPTNGQTYTSGSKSWTWTGTAWESVAAVGPTGPTGPTGPIGLSYSGVTSTSSNTIGTGSKTFSVPLTGAYSVGARVRVANTTTPSNYVEGLITSVTTNTSIVVSVDTVGGSGTFTAWTFSIIGNIGPTGPTGAANTLSVSSTTTGNPGTSAAVTISGTAPSQSLAFTIPQGPTGPIGPTGPSNVLSVSSTTTGNPGTSAAVTISGTSPSQSLAFTIPQGPTGPTGAIGPTGPAGASTVPAGSLVMFGASTIPSGWLLCNGQLISRTTFSGLFSVIGTTYGAGDGSTTFAVPDLRGRVAVGFDSTQVEFDLLGEVGGAKTHTLTLAQIPSHSHDISHSHSGSTSSDGSHSHSFTLLNNTNVLAGGTTNSSLHNSLGSAVSKSTDAAGLHSHSVSISTLSGSSGTAGSGQAHNILQPYIVMNYIIKT